MATRVVIDSNIQAMEPKISKSQTEVWDWKEKAFEALKDLPIEAQLAEIHRQTAATVASIRQKQEAKRAATSAQ